MIDFERARAQMVESQVRAGGVTDAAILARMRMLAREDFVSPHRRDLAYSDDLQWLGNAAGGRFMAPPITVAKLLKLAQITPVDDVLEIGAGTGYATAIIAGMAATVIGLEQDSSLAAIAAANLERLGLANAAIGAGDIADLGDRAFDVIMVQGTIESVPTAWIAALRDGGRLVALIRTGAVSIANILVKSKGSVTARSEFNAVLPPLYAAQHNEEFVF